MNKTSQATISRLVQAGFSLEEARSLRRCAMTLSRWDEQCCGDSNDHCSWSIERDEETGKPFRVIWPHDGKSRRFSIPDRERGAEKRAESIARSRGMIAYHQSDPRGASLYIVSPDDLRGQDIHAVYNRGIAVCF